MGVTDSVLMGMLLNFLGPQSPYLSNGHNILSSEVLINLSKSAQHKALSLNRKEEQIMSLNLDVRVRSPRGHASWGSFYSPESPTPLLLPCPWKPNVLGSSGFTPRVFMRFGLHKGLGLLFGLCTHCSFCLE